MHPKLHSSDRLLQWRTCLVVQDPFPLCSPTQQLEQFCVQWFLGLKNVTKNYFLLKLNDQTGFPEKSKLCRESRSSQETLQSQIFSFLLIQKSVNFLSGKILTEPYMFLNNFTSLMWNTPFPVSCNTHSQQLLVHMILDLKKTPNLTKKNQIPISASFLCRSE